jgi:hypothetical protein
MADNTRQTLFIVPDPSSLLSYPHLQDLMNVLADLKDKCAYFQVLLPNLLLNYVEKGLQEEIIDPLVELYLAWLPSKSKEDAKKFFEIFQRTLSTKHFFKSLKQLIHPKLLKVMLIKKLVRKINSPLINLSQEKNLIKN